MCTLVDTRVILRSLEFTMSIERERERLPLIHPTSKALQYYAPWRLLLWVDMTPKLGLKTLN